MKYTVKHRLDDLIARYPVLEQEKASVTKAYAVMEACFQTDGRLLIAGNGGSAADADHMVGELMKGFVKPRKVSRDFSKKLLSTDRQMGQQLSEKLQGALPAIALTNHTALSTAYLNDADPLLGFAQQVYGYGRKGDVLLAISTSGSSRNILYACVAARAIGMQIIGLTGGNGGRLKEFADVTVAVAANETYQVQELHLPIYHTWCLMLEEQFFGGQGERDEERAE